MTDSDVQQIPMILAALENLKDSVARIEGVIAREISDLKTEQIADLRRMLEAYAKDTKDQIVRVADDQRRLWDAVRQLEDARNRTVGVMHAGKWVSTLMAGGVGAGLLSVVQWLFGTHGTPPHP